MAKKLIDRLDSAQFILADGTKVEATAIRYEKPKGAVMRSPDGVEVSSFNMERELTTRESKEIAKFFRELRRVLRRIGK